MTFGRGGAAGIYYLRGYPATPVPKYMPGPPIATRWLAQNLPVFAYGGTQGARRRPSGQLGATRALTSRHLGKDFNNNTDGGQHGNTWKPIRENRVLLF